MKNICDCGKAHLVGRDGGLRHLPSYLVSELEKQGFRQVLNPKRSYFPEFDQTHPSFKTIEVEENPDILPGEWI